MAYEMIPALEAEKKLFFRLDGEAAERHGAVGYMRADFGQTGKEFWTTWFDCQKHLKTPAFKREFDEVINSLRNDGDNPPFASRYGLAVFCADNHGVEMPAGRGEGFRIQTPDFSYCVRCNPRYGGYDIGLYAYDNRYLLPELAGQHELPDRCYSVMPSSGALIILVNGVSGYVECADSQIGAEGNRPFADTTNKLNGVTRAQEKAMLAGTLFGWDTPAAKPWNYEPDGTPRKPPKDRNRESER
jgi:hypothetical protein